MCKQRRETPCARVRGGGGDLDPSTLAGIRSVLDTGKANPSKESRDEVLWNEDGLVTITGGKLIVNTLGGVPISTTHSITGAIMGVGATKRLSGVRWGLAGNILWAWILTIPMSAGVGALTFALIHLLTGKT